MALPEWLDPRTLGWLADEEMRTAHKKDAHLGIDGRYHAVRQRHLRVVHLRNLAVRVERRRGATREDGGHE